MPAGPVGLSTSTPAAKSTSKFSRNASVYSYLLTSGLTLNDGNWHYIVATHAAGGANASSLSIYCDGALVTNNGPSNAGTITTFKSTNSLTIGNDNLLGTFTGTLDEVAVYGSAADCAAGRGPLPGRDNGVGAGAGDARALGGRPDWPAGLRLAKAAVNLASTTACAGFRWGGSSTATPTREQGNRYDVARNHAAGVRQGIGLGLYRGGRGRGDGAPSRRAAHGVCLLHRRAAHGANLFHWRAARGADLFHRPGPGRARSAIWS